MMKRNLKLILFISAQLAVVLTIIMVVLAPLTLITGVLGSNSVEVTENPYGFLWISMTLLLLGVLQVWYFKRKHWF